MRRARLAALGEQAHARSPKPWREELQLNLPEQPWHTQRDRLVEFASVLGLIAGSLGKIGRDISLLMQTEAAEVFEPSAPGKGGSSTMPHKRNPVGAAVLIGAATRVPGLVATHVQRHAPGARAQPGLVACRMGNPAGDLLPGVRRVATGAVGEPLAWKSTPSAWRSNLDLTQGLVLAEAVSIVLAQRVGRDTAHHLLEQCCKRAVAEQRHLRAVLADEPQGHCRVGRRRTRPSA